MAFAERIESLRTKHAALEGEIRAEHLRAYPDTTMLTRLKREKLRVKEEIDRLQHSPH